ncbi:hypothetical protein [Ammoniphilus sp. CFH 90114]|uniref:hypothetical protein n=1 Tax=Ammoniphilus sp. CFH 90114 TaxID=2493665 RepID=UPI00100FA294|nr:hypothetical protein [Ammoniphilus sp. CFH 90114]RXT02325.1 hypothetical protein EIZ39_25020 [Ammoniphilus sp. CFH 90114]
MKTEQWITEMERALQGINGNEFLALLKPNHQLMKSITEHFAVEYAKKRLGQSLNEDMYNEGLNPSDSTQIMALIKRNKEQYRTRLLPLEADGPVTGLAFANHPAFPELIEILTKTENVNRSNVSAVLVVASRRSPRLAEVVSLIQENYEQDMEKISHFFKQYFEAVKGWKFNKMNRKESEGNVNAITKLTDQLACWILLDEEKEASKMLMEVGK